MLSKLLASNIAMRIATTTFTLLVLKFGSLLRNNEGNVTPIRCIIENVSGFIVHYRGYQEITTDKGITILKSISEKGPLHLQPVHQAYPTKESLQPRRYQAHLFGTTTYVYDFPDLFKLSKALHKIKARATDSSLIIPKVFLESKELILDEHDHLTKRPAIITLEWSDGSSHLNS